MSAQDQGSFNFWLTDRLNWQILPPQTGSTGDYNRWLTDRIDYWEYAAKVTRRGHSLSGFLHSPIIQIAWDD